MTTYAKALIVDAILVVVLTVIALMLKGKT